MLQQCKKKKKIFVSHNSSQKKLSPRKEHWEAVKWILRYLRGTSKVCFCFGNSEPILDGYTYLNMADDVDSRKLISGFLMTFVDNCLLAI